MNKIEIIKNFYLDNGFKVFPVMENKKIPLIDEWQNNCSNDFFQIIYWLEQAPNCNIGLPANENNLFIIDIDMHDGINGIASYSKLLNNLGLTLDDTITKMQKTPSGGIHFIFQSDNELKNVINNANCFKDYPGIDIRTRGYILVEPSIIDGKEYVMTLDSINKMPEKLKEFILKNNTVEKEKRKEYIKPEKVERGGRDIALFDYIVNLYYTTRLDYEEILLLAYHFNQTVCSPPFSNSTVDYKVRKIFERKRNKYISLIISDEEDMERDEE